MGTLGGEGLIDEFSLLNAIVIAVQRQLPKNRYKLTRIILRSLLLVQNSAQIETLTLLFQSRLPHRCTSGYLL